MIVLGISGGLSLPYEDLLIFKQQEPHDAAAALSINGRIVSVIEEERLNRIKHTNKAPYFAIKYVLNEAGIQLNQVDKVAVYSNEDYINGYLKMHFIDTPKQKTFCDIRTYVNRILTSVNGDVFDDSKIEFVDHHVAHAVSAFALSGFDRSLVAIFDGTGNGLSGMIMKGETNGLELIKNISQEQSLGWYYCDVINYLGYDQFDEYKVMGLAPYGDPETFEKLFESFYELLPDGDYVIHNHRLGLLAEHVLERSEITNFSQKHKDIAAALQVSLERIVLHVLTHYKEKYNYTKLCLAGGVANNCSMNGKILYSGLFEDIFVQPGSHDAGCAIGASLHSYFSNTKTFKIEKFNDVYFGTDIGNEVSIRKELAKWNELITFEKVDNIEELTARHMAEGAVIGWVQGRSEFGPRALGNRSIIADPRPEENKNIINAMIKKREGYRPFAPSILEEYVNDYFVTHNNKTEFPYMTFVLNVKPDKQKLLGATTHVDGTSRIQTVSKKTNEKYWNLIEEFSKLTGVPVVLNTSFNNNAEPIVDSVEDAVICFLTTNLNFLVVGDYFVTKKDYNWSKYLNFRIGLPIHVTLGHKKSYTAADIVEDIYELEFNYSTEYIRSDYKTKKISKEAYNILCEAEIGSLTEIFRKKRITNDLEKKILIEEFISLLGLRMVKIYSIFILLINLLIS